MSLFYTGYILVGLVAGDVAGGQAALFSLLVYAFMNLGAFGVVMLLAPRSVLAFAEQSIHSLLM
jgi:NADH:ubiquinone oxidoreductase subunit 2 (subunit N)